AGGMHGANRLGGNSLSDLLVFGQRAGAGAAARAASIADDPYMNPVQIRAAEEELEAPLTRTGGTDPYRLRELLQATMQSLVGIYRTASDLKDAIARIGDIRHLADDLCVPGGRAFNPGWNLVLELRNLIDICDAIAEFEVPVEEGMVVLDALHWTQAHAAPDLAVRWNCKAAKCGSCSAEVNGRPSLTCKTRLSDFDPSEPITVEPMRAFPLVRDLVTDVSWNYEINRSIQPFTPPAEVPQSDWRWQQEDIERVQEFRKCNE